MIDAMRHRTADLDGPVHYLDFGGEGSPLVMVHGLGGNSLNWMAVGPGFAENHHTYALDLAGFGRTPLFQRSAAVGANQALVHRFIEEVINEPVILMGNSMGGHISILEAAQHPRWVKAMVLVDPAIPGVHMARPDARMIGIGVALSIPGLAQSFMERRLRLLGPEGLVRETIQLVAADPGRVSPDIVAAHVQLTKERSRLGQQNHRAFLQATRSLALRMADPRFWSRVRQVQAPTLVLHGELDRLVPISAVRELVRRQPEWTLKVFEGVGHVPMMEIPQRFLSIAREWMTAEIAVAPETVSVS
jgi:pimeloyl-ACP methyl ester carboxylesterase